MRAHVHKLNDMQKHNKLSHPSFKIPEKLFEGQHVGRLDGFSTLVLLWAASVLGNGGV